MRKHLYPLLLAMLPAAPAAVGQTVPATADTDVTYPDGGAPVVSPQTDDDALTSGSFTFRGARMWYGEQSYWEGYCFSQEPGSDYATIDDQYKSAPGGGHDSPGFVVACPVVFSPDEPKCHPIEFAPAVIAGTWITNSAYAYNAMACGDGFARKFETGDYFRLTINGHGTDGTTRSIEYYLADMRSDDPADHYIVADWQWLDLSALGEIQALTFAFDSTDQAYGYINTPNYFCLDDLGAEAPDSGIAATTVRRPAGRARLFTLQGIEVTGRQALEPGIYVSVAADGTTRKILL